MIGVEELMQMFGHFDGNHDGRIDRDEFERLMAALGTRTANKDLDALFHAIDENGNGTIDFHEFKGWWMTR